MGLSWGSFVVVVATDSFCDCQKVELVSHAFSLTFQTEHVLRTGLT